MKTRMLLAIGFACSLTLTVSSQQNCITIPEGESRLVGWPCSLPTFIGAVPFVHFLSWNGNNFDENVYMSGWWDFPPLPCGGNAVIVYPTGGPVTICFPEPNQSPTLPLRLGCGFNLVSCQSNVVAGFEDIVGRSPWEGVQVYKFNAGPGRRATNFAPPDYTIYTFSAGSWSPTVPIAEALEGVVVYQPPPKLWNLQIVGGLVHFDVTAPPDRTVIVEYAEECGSVTWTEIGRFTGSGVLQPVTDQVGGGASSQRFYRARLL